MHVEKILPLAKAVLKKILIRRKFDLSTGGTNLSRYCYAVWMRHLVFAHNNGIKLIPETIAELGPGDSLGIGLTGLLTGSSKYYAMDVHKYWDINRNLEIFDELVLLLKKREPIPGDKEFPRTTPALKDYAFPSHILSDDHLEQCLTDERVSKIRKEILQLDKQESNSMLKYFIHQDNNNVIEENSVDFIYSQAVLQYVDDLDSIYGKMKKWLKNGGIMSHSIDFSSHGITKSWNGHWLFSEAEWKLIHGNNKVILNRAPQSTHLHLHEKHNFEIINKMDYKKPSPLSVQHFFKKFRNLLPEDLSTSVMVIQARKFAYLLLLFVHKSSFSFCKYSNTVSEVVEVI